MPWRRDAPLFSLICSKKAIKSRNDPAFQRWYQRHHKRQAVVDQVHQPAQQGLSQRAIARETGLHRRTVKQWLQEPISAEQTTEQTETPIDQAGEPDEPDAPPAQPTAQREIPNLPETWNSWEEVHQVREALQEHRFLFVMQPNHLTKIEQSHVTQLLSSPVGTQLQLPYSFLQDWFGFWKDDQGQCLPLEETLTRYRAWQAKIVYQQNKPL